MGSSDSISRASYWQYKDDTGYVLKWIEQTAKACGWKRSQAKQPVPGPSNLTLPTTQISNQAKVSAKETTDANVSVGSKRLKGKDRKAARQQAAADQATPTKNGESDNKEQEIVYSALEIMSQANRISTCLSTSPSSVTRPPPSVMKSLYRAIRLRRKFSDWFEAARPHDSKSNSAHRYFIVVLEKITNLFAQAVGKKTVGPSQASTASASPGSDQEVKQNPYEALLEQVIQEDEENEPAETSKSANQTTAEQTTRSDWKYQIEIKDSQEIALMVFTPFTDLHDIREDMKSLWKRCFKDGADKVVATLMTAQALAFVQDLESKIIATLDSPRYQHISSHHDHEKRAWSFPGTYCRLLDVLRDPNDLQAVLAFEDSTYETGETDKILNMNDLTFAYSARRLSKLTVGVNGEWCKPLLLDFEYNPFALLNADHGLGIVDRDTNLCRLVAEMMYLRYASPPGGPHRKLAEQDRRIESMRQDPILSFLHPVCMWTQEEVITGVFAAEIMLDIYDLTEEFPTARPSYAATYKKYMKLLCLEPDTDSAGQPIVKQTNGSSYLLRSNEPGWNNKVKETMDKALCMLPVPNAQANDLSSEKPQQREPEYNGDAWKIYQDLTEPRLPIKYETEHYQNGPLFDMTWLTRDVHYVFNHYTMFCTHREAFMQTLIESIGLDILNHVDRYGLGAVAHVYNASRQLGIGNLQWPAIERLIKLQTVALFAGDPPTTAADMLKRFKHRYWGPNRNMSQKAKANLMNRPATQMKPSVMTQAFNLHWDTCGRIPFWHSLKENVLTAATETKAARKRATTKDTPLTKQRFVEDMPAMVEYLTEQLRDVRVDYNQIDQVSAVFNQRLHEHAREVFAKIPNRNVPNREVDRWSGIDFESEAFEQEARFHELRIKAGGDISKLPIQDCDYLLDSINCLANTLYAFGIGRVRGAVAVGEGINVPVVVRRFRIRGSEDM